MNSINQFKKVIPSLISISRIIIAPIFLIAFIDNLWLISVLLYIFAVSTDALDGYIARKYELTSTYGAYMDITADFILILVGFLGFVLVGIYPFWVIILIVLMFVQFIITSKADILIYDPIGKYYGSFLFITIFITLLSNNSSLNLILLILIVIFSFISILSRAYYLINGKNNI